jgi:hypothetical protein
MPLTVSVITPVLDGVEGRIGCISHDFHEKKGSVHSPGWRACHTPTNLFAIEMMQ